MTNTRKHTPRADVFHIGKIIESNIEPDGESDGVKYVKYKADWSDDRVAKVSGIDLGTVRRIRQDLFGQLRRGSDVFFKPILSRLEALERRVAELEDAATKPRVVRSFSDIPVNGSRS